jgi:PAS domain S-box-containing protein
MPSTTEPASSRLPLLARMRVGTKLMLLVLLPVGVLLVFTIVSATDNQRDADRLGEFRGAARLSFRAADVAEALAGERAATVIHRLRPASVTRPEVALAQQRVDAAIERTARQARHGEQPLDVGGRLDAARRQLRALRVEAATRSLGAYDIAARYGVIADSLVEIVRGLDASRPARDSGRAADAYIALLQAIEAAERERVNLAAALAAPGDAVPRFPLRWVAWEAAELAAFRENAAGRLIAELDASLFQPAGFRVSQVRERLAEAARGSLDRTSLGQWLAASGARISDLRRVERETARELDSTASGDLGEAEANVRRDLAVWLAVLALVVGFALVLRRSITRPLEDVSEGARRLSSGELASGVSYAGHDEIGDVAAAFRDVRVTAERFADEIRAMNVAIEDNRLDHRAEVQVFEGTWARLLDGMNATMESFAGLQSRRRRAEREAEQIFDLSLDLLGIGTFDGYFRRVSPAFERTLGYSSEQLLSRPFFDFIHPDDRERSRAALDGLARGESVVQFENRYVHRDGSVRWLQWNVHPVPDEGLVYAAARDITDSRRARDEQVALRRLATAVAKGVPPAEIFSAVAREVSGLFGTARADVLRYEADGSFTVLGSARDGAGESCEEVAAAVARSERAIRTDRMVAAPIVVEDRVWGVIAAPADDGPLAADADARLARFTDLIATAIANAESRAQLAASRARVVTAADEARRRIERDLHDGTQQRLIALGLELHATEAMVPAELTELRARLASTASGLAGAFEDLQELSRGIHPVVLSRGGLGPALRTLARASVVPVELDLDLPDGSRLPAHVEVGAYYVVSEALTNAVKHAQASVVRVCVSAREERLELSIRDDGVGGAKPGGGSGLVGLADRVDALGGKLRIISPFGEGTLLRVALPLGVHAEESPTG